MKELEMTGSTQKLIKMTDKEYFSLPYISNSAINTIKTEGIESYYYNTFGLGANRDKPENLNYTLGSLVHCLILEPSEFENRYLVSTGKAPSSTNMKAFCEFVAMGVNPIMVYKQCYQVSSLRDTDIENKARALLADMDGYIRILSEQREGNKKIITEDMYKQAVSMTESFCTSYPDLCKLMITKADGVFAEYVGIGKDELGTYKFKADLITTITNTVGEYKPLRPTIYDIKTTEFVGENQLIDTIARWNYKQQAAFYTRCLSLCTGIEVKDIDFYFLFISKTPPYSTTTVEVCFNTLLKERASLTNWLKDNQVALNNIENGTVTNKRIVV